MIRRYIPFALGGVVVAMIAAAGIPSAHRDAPLVKPYAPTAKKVAPAPVPPVPDDFESEPSQLPEPPQDHFNAEWHDRFRLTPQAAIQRELPKVDFQSIHEATETSGKSKSKAKGRS